MRLLGSLASLIATLMLLPGWSALATPPEPVPPVGIEAGRPFASPYEVAYDAIRRFATPEGRVSNEPGSATYFTRDAMMAILVEVERAARFPSQAAVSVARAETIWEAANAAYNLQGRAYDVTLTARAICFQLDVQAWALLAADALAEAAGRPDVAQRAASLATTLADGASTGASGGFPRCPIGQPVHPSQWPVTIWALLRHAETTGVSNWATTAMRFLDEQIAARWRGVFEDETGLAHATTNAQFLLALQTAAERDASKYAPRRDALAARLESEFLQASDDGLSVLSVEGGQSLPEADPVAHAWMAYALHNQRRFVSNVSADAPERVLDHLLGRFWSSTSGTFASKGGRGTAEASLLTALVTAGPAMRDASSEGARVAFVVPASSLFSYPDPGAANATQYWVSSEWIHRFSLEAFGPATQPVVLPLSALGPIHHIFPESSYARPPSLQRGGNAVPVEAEGTQYPLVRFTTTLTPPAPYRLVEYAPVRPISSELQREIRFFFVVESTASIPLDLLRLDIQARNVTLGGLRVNDQMISSDMFDVSNVQATEELPFAHVRVDLRGLEVDPGVVNEVWIGYDDPEAPTILDVSFTEDPDGRVPFAYDEKERKYTVSAGGQAWVRARVTDNAALRSASVLAFIGLNATTTAMEAVEGEPGVYRASIDAPPLRKDLRVRIRALDEHGTLAQYPADGDYVVRSVLPFLRQGNTVLMVFAGVLFFSAAFIFFKMGRGRRS